MREQIDINDRLTEYEICKVRGHTDSGQSMYTNVRWDICKWCGTHYRYEIQRSLIESGAPEKTINESDSKAINKE